MALDGRKAKLRVSIRQRGECNVRGGSSETVGEGEGYYQNDSKWQDGLSRLNICKKQTLHFHHRRFPVSRSCLVFCLMAMFQMARRADWLLQLGRVFNRYGRSMTTIF